LSVGHGNLLEELEAMSYLDGMDQLKENEYQDLMAEEKLIVRRHIQHEQSGIC
jgi:hypothetical protein